MRAKRAGWIQAAFIAAAISASPGAAQAAPATVTQPLNVRGGPGTAFPIINRLPAGSTVNTNGCSAGWCDIGGDAFVSEAYLNFGGCACAQPVRPRVARPVKAPRPVVAAPPAVVVPVAVTAGPVFPMMPPAPRLVVEPNPAVLVAPPPPVYYGPPPRLYVNPATPVPGYYGAMGIWGW